MGVVLLRATNGLAHRRMKEAALDLDHDRLGVLVADHDTLANSFRHGLSLSLGRHAALFVQNRLHPSDVPAQHANAAGVLGLSIGALEAQVELLLLQAD